MLAAAFAARFIVTTMMLGAPSSATGAEGLKAWLERVPRGEMVEFKGYVSAPAPMVVNYRLSVLRMSRSGQSRTAQRGQVEIREPNQPTQLSLTAINVGSSDFYEVELVAIGTNGDEVRVELTRRPREMQ